MSEAVSKDVADLFERADEIGLPVAVIAERAGVPKQTLFSIKSGKSRNPLHRTIKKVSRVIVAEELWLRDRLCARHGLPEAVDGVAA